ncbi:hypothetical protein ASE86_04250 [Sphingomonas sp. Leaf33]|uniref:hypothetical protein n=1 Tax=Sphingomonas sp. Leaf33 TaxID=1736215 RepID=UPI0006F9B9BB|nr:hypothetical protein [Sphingomonas sp. Leaf33]KQN25455.1 hypothetical protein ASE86_04250 [Sphingomonas sp. Leaf33]
MTGDPQFTTPEFSTAPERAPFASTAPRRRGRGTVIVALFAFLIGLVAMYYALPALQRWTSGGTTTAPAATQAMAQPVASQTSRSAPADPGTVDALTVRTAALDAQLRGIEGRMAAADTASRTAAAQSRRAEGLLIAFAARRAIDRGLPLGYLEPQLRARFGADQPQAVATVIRAVGSPTLADLREGLTQIAPTLTTGSSRDGFFKTLWRELSTLVIVRRDSTPSSRPDDRLGSARLILDGGNVEGALAEVVRMPGASNASNWIDAAKRYIDTRRALNALEVAAIGTPLPAEPAVVATPPVVTPAPTAPAGAVPAPDSAGTQPGA